MNISPKLKPQIILLLTAIVFLLAQFIGEYVIVYGIIQFMPDFAATLYASKQVIITVHLIITFALVAWAKRISESRS